MGGSIVVHEHGRLTTYGEGKPLTTAQLTTLGAFHARDGNHRYFDLIHRGVKFKSFVGVLRVGTLTIEVLPKLDDHLSDTYWRNRLLDMLRVTTEVNVHHPTTSHLRTRPNNILEYYLELFTGELEQLLHGGLTKAYHPRHGNRTALRGRLLMSRHLTENVLHRERFYVADTTYDFQHPLNQILRQALQLSRRLATAPSLQNRLAELDLRMPELPDLRITPALFDRLTYGRKTTAYRPAIEIARLLLLNVHPDIQSGRDDVLALLFNMNTLWEGFLRQSLQRYLPEGYSVRRQPGQTYWQPERGLQAARLEPDLFILREGAPYAILDAKWKRHDRPSANDLQQLFSYVHHYDGVRQAALVYPGRRGEVAGQFTYSGFRGDLLWSPVPEGEGSVREWMRGIGRRVGGWLL